jgi:hypothetical protein
MDDLQTRIDGVPAKSSGMSSNSADWVYKATMLTAREKCVVEINNL